MGNVEDPFYTGSNEVYESSLDANVRKNIMSWCRLQNNCILIK